MTLTPINSSDLRERLSDGIISFAFKKLNGHLRTAVGTTNLSSIPVQSHPKGGRPKPETQIAYWDLEKGQWRSLNTAQEIFIS